MFYTYLIQSTVDSTFYIGHSSNVHNRLLEHNKGKTKSIKHKLPMRLIYYEAYPTKTQAIKRERQLKNNQFEKEKILKRLSW